MTATKLRFDAAKLAGWRYSQRSSLRIFQKATRLCKAMPLPPIPCRSGGGRSSRRRPRVLEASLESSALQVNKVNIIPMFFAANRMFIPWECGSSRLPSSTLVALGSLGLSAPCPAPTSTFVSDVATCRVLDLIGPGAKFGANKTGDQESRYPLELLRHSRSNAYPVSISYGS